MPSNYDVISSGFDCLNSVLAPYVCNELKGAFDKDWWEKGVLAVLHDSHVRHLPDKATDKERVASFDVLRTLVVMDNHWETVFKSKLSREHRNWIKELISTRNKCAHKGLMDASEDDAWRALDTMARLAEQIDAAATEKLREMARKVRYGTEAASSTVKPVKRDNGKEERAPASDGIITEVSRAGLKPWRDVVEPHPDVAQGRYRQAEFAADLSQVARGTAEAEYQDPVEFFARTYITSGMTSLLVAALKRAGSEKGKEGDPVIKLKTGFGGGKTHSMLALFHLFRAGVPASKLAGVPDLLEKAGLSKIPKAKVVVLVGTALDPNKARRPANQPGIMVRTLWGEIAAQISEQVRNPEPFDLVKEADKKGVPPGSDVLAELLDKFGPCVILIDELVAYARKIYNSADLSGGSYEANLTFVQELTEAVRKSKKSTVIATIPESDIEKGGDVGKAVCAQIENTFGRLETVWKPVEGVEGFEVVRRRLFLDVHDEDGRDAVCRAFSDMYRRGGEGDFPTECRESAYYRRLLACYPIHPEIFDHLYDDWSTLERFQRTRGVLRLMAAVVHELWDGNDQSHIIMPGSIPMNTPEIRNELTRHLGEEWNGIVDKDVDGTRSEPHRIDRENPRFGKLMAARRVSRTIFLGSAPSVREQRVRGIEDVHIRLGVVQPGDQISVFNDALGKLSDTLTHLYSHSKRFWYDVRPNLRRTAIDRAEALKREPEKIEEEVKRRLHEIRDRADFHGVHKCPASGDVPDEKEARLVILSPGQTHKKGDPASPAIAAATDILENRGSSPRHFKNMLICVATDEEAIGTLNDEVREYLAWTSIVGDTDTLNLDAQQAKQAGESELKADEATTRRLNEAYSWLLVPTQEAAKPIELAVSRIPGASDSCIGKAAARARKDESLIVAWSPALLKNELDKWLWKDKQHIGTAELWDYLARYCYLSRLRDEEVLVNAIRDGIRSRDFFGYAAAVDDKGRYQGLQFGGMSGSIFIDSSSVLVKPETAKAQIAADAEVEKGDAGGGKETVEVKGGAEAESSEEPGVPPVPRRFHGAVALDPTRISRDAGRVADEVIQHLTKLVGARVEVTLEIRADVPAGVPDQTVRTVTENCRTLKFESQGFEKE